MKGLTKTYAIDANIILRYLLRDHEELSPKAKAIMDAVQAGRIIVNCDPVQLAEVVWVLKSSYGLGSERTSELLEPIVSADSFRIPNKALYLEALYLYATSVHSFGDACACAAAMELCEGRLLSFDKKLSGVNGITRAEEL